MVLYEVARQFDHNLHQNQRRQLHEALCGGLPTAGRAPSQGEMLKMLLSNTTNQAQLHRANINVLEQRAAFVRALVHQFSCLLGQWLRRRGDSKAVSHPPARQDTGHD